MIMDMLALIFFDVTDCRQSCHFVDKRWIIAGVAAGCIIVMVGARQRCVFYAIEFGRLILNTLLAGFAPTLQTCQRHTLHILIKGDIKFGLLSFTEKKFVVSLHNGIKDKVADSVTSSSVSAFVLWGWLFVCA